MATRNSDWRFGDHVPLLSESSSANPGWTNRALRLRERMSVSGLLFFVEAGQVVAEFLVLVFQPLHATFQRLQCFPNFFLGETRDDVLLAIPIERFHLYHEYPLNGCLVSWIADFLNPFFRLRALKYLHMPKDFQAKLPRVIDKD